MSFNEEVQFDFSFYRSALEPGLGGEDGIFIIHLIYFFQWSASITPQSRPATHLLECISLAWFVVVGGVKTLAPGGETGMRGKDADDWALFGQTAMKHNAQHQTARLVERRNASIRSAVQRAESQVIKEASCISFATVLGLDTSMHNALVPINAHTPYQALLGRQPHLLPPLGGG